MDSKKCFVAGCLLAGFAVGFGAFGAHSLENALSFAQKKTWETAVVYQFVHALALLFLGLFLEKNGPNWLLSRAAWCFLVGVVFFSGSLYLLACRDILIFKIADFVGPITPIGGLLFLTGWAMSAWAFWQHDSKG